MARKPLGKPVRSTTGTTSATRGRALGLMSALGRGRAGVKLLASGADRRVQVITTGVDTLDVAIGAGGYPIGRMVILHGGESCGKTTSALIACAEVQRRHGVAIYLDCEHKLDLAYAESLGVDVESLVLMYPDSIERAFKKLSKILRILRGLPVKKVKKGRFDGPPVEEEDLDDEDVPVNAEAMGDLAGFDFPIVAVLDSFQSLVAQRTFDAEYDKEGYNPESGAWAKSLAKFCPELDDLRTLLIGISQVRMDLSANSYGPKKEKVGVGKAPVHHATIVLRWTGRKKQGNLKKGVTGELHEVFVAKNQIGIPYRVATIPIVFGEGVDLIAAAMAAAQATGVLQKAGAKYVLDLPSGETITGLSGFREMAANNPDLFAAVRAEVRNRMGGANIRTVSKEEAEIESLDEA